MKFKDLGPFPGITYLGRQRLEATLNATDDRVKAALTRLAERQNDVIEEEEVISPSYSAFLAAHNSRGKWIFCILLIVAALFFGGTFYLILLGYGGSLFRDGMEMRQIGAVVVIALIGIAAGYLIIWALRNAINILRYGYASWALEPKFSELTACRIYAGEVSLFVSTGKFIGKRPEVKTVFYDAIGSIEVSQHNPKASSIDIMSRDGSLIVTVPFPSTDHQTDPQEICDTLNLRLLTNA